MNMTLKNKSDRKIVEYLYNTFGSKLFKYAVSSWKLEEDEIWEILYKTLYKFIEAYSYKEFDDEKQIVSIVWVIFKNKLRDAIRKNKRIKEHYKEVIFDEDITANGVTLESNNEPEKIHPLLIHLEEVLSGFEDWERQLVLCRANNIPYKEIEKLTNKKVENLKVYYARLKNKIAKQLQKYIDE